jgi:4-diphosphocytidyl-2-C-methyl-D-erythritol kinase
MWCYGGSNGLTGGELSENIDVIELRGCPMGKMLFQAPAKINLCLHVLGRREDGYHELAMVMQRVSLCDDVFIDVGDSGSVSVRCAGVVLSEGEDNIAARAAKLLLERAGLNCAVDIEIVKRIPVAAGLGGGSSDAAAVLMGLNEMLDVGLSGADLQELGAQLGADVPFFIYGGPAWATGTGTNLRPLASLPAAAYLLVNPGFGVSTSTVYQSLQLTKGGRLANLPRFSVTTIDDLCAALHNDLECVVMENYSEILDIKQALVAAGALGTLMSGSGATVFGVFESFSEASSAGQMLSSETDWITIPVRPL